MNGGDTDLDRPDARKERQGVEVTGHEIIIPCGLFNQTVACPGARDVRCMHASNRMDCVQHTKQSSAIMYQLAHHDSRKANDLKVKRGLDTTVLQHNLRVKFRDVLCILEG